jgi:hypothetical protein
MADDKKKDLKEAIVAEATSPTPAEALAQMSPEDRKQIQLIKAVMMEVVPALVAMKSAPEAKEAKQRMEAAERKILSRRVCSVCLQPLTACENKHVQLTVYPSRYPEFAKGFPGVTINGVTYLSAQNRTVPVPECAAPYIAQMVTAYETNMRESISGRTAEHNSGNLSGGGIGETKTNSANVGWR